VKLKEQALGSFGETRIMKSIVACALLCLASLAGSVHAQEWNAAQKEVWKNVEAFWARDAAADVEGYLSYIDDGYVGWNLNDPLPTDKARYRRYYEHASKREKTVFYDIQPVAINVVGNVAIAHYYYFIVVRDADGKERDVSGRWADIWMKQGDRWALIGDHGGRTSDE
jgi:ketosteroid isomerase-like protein